MIDLSKLQPVGRKIYVQKLWKDYEGSRNTKAIVRSVEVYEDPTNKEFEKLMDLSTWKDTVDKKVNYLLAREPVVDKKQEEFSKLLEFVKKSATQYLLKGSLVWIVDGDGVSPVKVPKIMNNTIAVYADEDKENTVAYIRKYNDISVDALTGSETTIEMFECYYYAIDEKSQAKRLMKDTFCYADPARDKSEPLVEEPSFIQLNKTGTAPLFAYVEKFLCGLDRIYTEQDEVIFQNTKPLIEVRGYQGDSDEELARVIEQLAIARTDGNGGVTVHERHMDSSSVDIWRKALMTKYYEATCIVGKDNELQYAMSGKAMDRLFIDMENSAKELAHVLEEALKKYFKIVYNEDIEITWNTDRPVDDAGTINAIVQSRGILSDKTLLEQHPWVKNVDDELKRLEEQRKAGGWGDLTDDDDVDDEDIE